VLSFLAKHPRESFTLSRLSRELEMNPATAHAMLTELVNHRFLIRHPEDKTFSLGPALVEIGAAAVAEPTSVLPYASREMANVAHIVGRQCLATAIVGDELVIMAAAGKPDPFGLTVSVGHRFPFTPPLGLVFLAGASDAGFAEWLTRSGADTGREHEYRRTVASILRVGYAIGLRDPEARLPSAAREPRASGQRRGSGDLNGSHLYAINYIAAPIYRADGFVVLSLHLAYFGDSVTGADAHQHASVLRAASMRVTESIHGSPPNPERLPASETTS
jgi:DNA-binding IclR family transcriptional regulator